jgi:hypothetical protein
MEVTGGTPSEKVLYVFRPKKTLTFYGNEYIAGMPYHVREGNELLQAFMQLMLDLDLAEVDTRYGSDT